MIIQIHRIACRTCLCLILVSGLLIFKGPLYASGESRVGESILVAIDLLYDQQFVEAESLFSEHIKQFPEDPTGYFYMAMVSWSRLASGFWSQEAVKEYKDRIDRCVLVAKTSIKKRGEQSHDLFYLGGALGFLARFELMENNHVSSFFLAAEAIEALKKCQAVDPQNKDVLLGLGIFDYYTARFSGVLKFFTYLLLHRGDKSEGLRKIHVAAREGVYSKTEAKSILLHIYFFPENNPKEALPICEDLCQQYGRNSRYRYLLGVIFVRLGRDKDYETTLRLMREKAAESSPRGAPDSWQIRANYLEGVHALYRGRYPQARKAFEQIVQEADPKTDPAMIPWSLVKIGASYDLEGNRQDAVRYYTRVMNLENGAGAQFLAKRFMSWAPAKDDPLLGY